MIPEEKRIKSSILLIYTGGTIGMKEDPVEQALKPFDFEQILQEVHLITVFINKYVRRQ